MTLVTMDHEMKKQQSKTQVNGNNGQHRFEDDFNTILTPAHSVTPTTRYSSYEHSNQVQFQFNPTSLNGQNSNNNCQDIYSVRVQRKKCSSKLCNPVVILSVVSLTAVAGALFSTFYMIHSLKPASTFMENVNGIIKSKEMKEVESTVDSFFKNATNWVKTNIGKKRNSTESETKKKGSGEMVLFGEGNGFSLNSLANLAGKIIKSVNETISSIGNNRTSTMPMEKKSSEAGRDAGQQSVIEKSAVSSQEDGSKSKLTIPNSSESERGEQLSSGQKVYHMS